MTEISQLLWWVLQLLLCPTLATPWDCSPPDSVLWDFPGKTLEWAAISFSLLGCRDADRGWY